MSLTFEVNVSGERLARELASEPEEMAYLLQSLIEDAPDDFGADIADYTSDVSGIVQFLRLLADHIEKRDAET